MSKTLQEKILKAQSEGDIASLYVLEGEVQEHFDDDELNEYYTMILDMAMENLTNALESARQMNISEVQDYATLRALYEYAMEHFSAGKKTDASALFEILTGLSGDKTFSEAMKVHKLGADAGLSIDTFIETIADVDATHKTSNFYISHFKKEALTAIEKRGKVS